MSFTPSISLPSNALSVAFKRRYSPSDKLRYAISSFPLTICNQHAPSNNNIAKTFKILLLEFKLQSNI